MPKIQQPARRAGDVGVVDLRNGRPCGACVASHGQQQRKQHAANHVGQGAIRGVESRGMLVSAAELKISDDHDGILDLPVDAPVGQPYASWAELDDPIIEIGLTPNRPDCTGVVGIAD